MATWTAIGWLLVAVLALAAGLLGGLLLVSWRSRRQWIHSIKYVIDRLRVAEADLRHLEEDLYVLKIHLQRRGQLDDEDLSELRRELIDRPRQLEAERQELLKEASKHGVSERLVKDVPDILQ
ncbi:MAG: hypothetical protein JXR96_29120 [Deltaproteobacteria bacterium]|nr:hypothetical protein [Deltaproteobacteria bacterium]